MAKTGTESTIDSAQAVQAMKDSSWRCGPANCPFASQTTPLPLRSRGGEVRSREAVKRSADRGSSALPRW